MKNVAIKVVSLIKERAHFVSELGIERLLWRLQNMMKARKTGNLKHQH
jgi:hypothetical protein